MDPRSDNLSAPSAPPREPVHALDDITGAIVDAALRIHMDLGPGLLESVYEVVLARALEKRGFRVERQKAIRFGYDGMIFEEGFRTDLLVEGRVVVELKVGGKARARPQQTSPDLSPPDGSTRRFAHQLRCSDAQRRTSPHRQQSPHLRVSAAPREPIPAMSRPANPLCDDVDTALRESERRTSPPSPAGSSATRRTPSTCGSLPDRTRAQPPAHREDRPRRPSHLSRGRDHMMTAKQLFPRRPDRPGPRRERVRQIPHRSRQVLRIGHRPDDRKTAAGGRKRMSHLADPPFNYSDKTLRSDTHRNHDAYLQIAGEAEAFCSDDDDVRWQLGVPPNGSANFTWVHHITQSGPRTYVGMFGFGLANGSMSSTQSGDCPAQGAIKTPKTKPQSLPTQRDIRRALMEDDLVD